MAGAKSSSFDWQRLIADINQEVHRLNRLHISLLEKAGVELIQGHVTFLDTHTLEVEGRQITAETKFWTQSGSCQTGFAGIWICYYLREIFPQANSKAHCYYWWWLCWIRICQHIQRSWLSSYSNHPWRTDSLVLDEDIHVSIQRRHDKSMEITCNTE